MHIERTPRPKADTGDLPPPQPLPMPAATPGDLSQPSITHRAINGWRGPGAIAVAVGHFAMSTDFFISRNLEPPYLIVDMFFVLSGLVIAQTYGARLANAAEFPQYFIRRIGRIWPMQVATLAILVAYELLKLALVHTSSVHAASPPFSPQGANLLEAIPSNIFLVHSLGLHDRETWNFPSWSLSVEFLTYILFAGVCLTPKLVRRTSSVIAVVGSLAILAFVAPLHARSTFDYGLFRCVSGFFAGALCCEFLAGRRLPDFPFPTFVEAAATGLVIAYLVYAPGTNAVYAAPLVFCFLIASYASERGAVTRMMKSKVIQVLSEGSLAIYMAHAIVLLVLLAGLHLLAKTSGLPLFTEVPNPLASHPGEIATIQILRPDSPLPKWIIALVYLAGVAVTAMLLYVCVEAPGRAAFGRLAKRFAPKGRQAHRTPYARIAPVKGDA